MTHIYIAFCCTRPFCSQADNVKTYTGYSISHLLSKKHVILLFKFVILLSPFLFFEGYCLPSHIINVKK